MADFLDCTQWLIDPVALLLLGVLVVGVLALLTIGELKIKIIGTSQCSQCARKTEELCPYGLCSNCCECH